VALSLEHRRVGDIEVVTCVGRIVEGDESRALQRMLDELLPFGRDFVLHLGGVDFLDSSGLGLLVRYLTRTRNAHGNLKLCAASPKIVEVLSVTRLLGVFDRYATEADAIAAFYEGGGAAVTPSLRRTDILCVEQSTDVLAYVRELLTQAGYGVLTAGNLPDGLILLQATRPKLVIASADFRAARSTAAAEKFNRIADALPVIELPLDFSRRDAADAGNRLLDQVRGALVVS
jgi:anti-sigma B factor antagonist